MADDWLYQPDSFDTLRVPFVFVPEGASVPADWLADHPHHIRVPAKFVPSRRSRGLSEVGRDRSSPVAATSGDGAAAGVSGSFAPVGVRGRRRWPPPPEIDRSGYLRETPVTAFLRANEMFVRLGAVEVGARPDKASPLAAPDARSIAPDDPDCKVGARSETSRNLGPGSDQQSAFAASGDPPPFDPTRRNDGSYIYDHTWARYADAAVNWVASTANQLIQNSNPISTAKAEVIWGHGDRHVSDLAAARIEILQNLPSASEIGGPFWGITPNYIYRAFPLPNGDLNVGTYYPR